MQVTIVNGAPNSGIDKPGLKNVDMTIPRTSTVRHRIWEGHDGKAHLAGAGWPETGVLVPVVAVQAAVLDRFCNVLGADIGGTVEVRDGSGNFQNTVVGSG
jgi:hypothetical protein